MVCRGDPTTHARALMETTTTTTTTTTTETHPPAVMEQIARTLVANTRIPMDTAHQLVVQAIATAAVVGQVVTNDVRVDQVTGIVREVRATDPRASATLIKGESATVALTVDTFTLIVKLYNPPSLTGA